MFSYDKQKSKISIQSLIGNVNINNTRVDVVKGDNIVIEGDVVTINGKRVDYNKIESDNTILDITINGDVEKVETQSGNITANKIQSAQTQSGDIESGTITGNCSTMSGNINSSEIKGNCTTMSGNINKR